MSNSSENQSGRGSSSGSRSGNTNGSRAEGSSSHPGTTNVASHGNGDEQGSGSGAGCGSNTGGAGHTTTPTTPVQPVQTTGSGSHDNHTGSGSGTGNGSGGKTSSNDDGSHGGQGSGATGSQSGHTGSGGHDGGNEGGNGGTCGGGSTHGTGGTGTGGGNTGATGHGTPTPAAPESLVLTTADVKVGPVAANVVTGASTADTLAATGGNDAVFGLKGNDTIRGSDAAPQSALLAIDGTLKGATDPNAVSFVIGGVPAGATLSAGHLNQNGSWTLTKADLVGLSVTAPNGGDFTLQVTASSTDGSHLVQAASLHVSIAGGAGNLLVGGQGSDTIYGSATGNDTIYGGNVPTGVHHIGPAHIPTVADNDVIHVGNGNVHAYGQAGNDTIYGGKGTGELNGGSGNDTIVAGGGNYLVKGGTGFDTLDFSAATGAVHVDLHKHTATGFGDLTIKGIEAIIGSSHDDILWGDRAGGTFTGGAGNDVFGVHKSDVKHGGMIHVTDFQAGDKLDLSELLGGRDAGAVLKVTDGADGTMVSVKIGKVFYDAVELDGVHGLTVADLIAKGLVASAAPATTGGGTHTGGGSCHGTSGSHDGGHDTHTHTSGHSGGCHEMFLT